VTERRRAVALARHFRESEGLSIAQIANRLGRSPATVKAYFYDPTREKGRPVKPRYVGVCRGCGAYTQPRNGKGDAHAYCKACHPGAIQARWTRDEVLAAMRKWRDGYGRLPSSYDWSRTHARATPVFPAHDGGFWDRGDWSNWRASVWRSRPERKYRRDGRVKVYRGTVGCAPVGTRPRDLRSSYVTLRVYQGVPLTTIGREVERAWT
jgi:hypothetical protein